MLWARALTKSLMQLQVPCICEYVAGKATWENAGIARPWYSDRYLRTDDLDHYKRNNAVKYEKTTSKIAAELACNLQFRPKTVSLKHYLSVITRRIAATKLLSAGVEGEVKDYVSFNTWTLFINAQLCANWPKTRNWEVLRLRPCGRRHSSCAAAGARVIRCVSNGIGWEDSVRWM